MTTTDTPLAARTVVVGEVELGLNTLVRDAAGNEFMITRIDLGSGRVVLKSTDAQWDGPRLVARSTRTLRVVQRFGKIQTAGAKALARIKTREAARREMIKMLVANATA